MRHVSCFLLLLILSSSLAQAGALRLSEVCTTDMGVASAGSAAVARDVGTTYFNPAGMTKLNCTELQVGGQIFIADVMFEKSDESLFSGGSGGQAGVVLPLLGTYFHTKVCDRLHFGLAINSPYGGTFNYGRDWVGRYYDQRVFIATLAFNPYHYP